MEHPTGTGAIQHLSHQRAGSWTPAVIDPPIPPLAKPASCHLPAVIPEQASGSGDLSDSERSNKRCNNLFTCLGIE